MRRVVAEFLLEEKHLLTALEFLQELRETGAEGSQSAAEVLESFFNDAGRFSSEQLQLSSASLGTYSVTPHVLTIAVCSVHEPLRCAPHSSVAARPSSSPAVDSPSESWSSDRPVSILQRHKMVLTEALPLPKSVRGKQAQRWPWRLWEPSRGPRQSVSGRRA